MSHLVEMVRVAEEEEAVFSRKECCPTILLRDPSTNISAKSEMIELRK